MSPAGSLFGLLDKLARHCHDGDQARTWGELPTFAARWNALFDGDEIESESAEFALCR